MPPFATNLLPLRLQRAGTLNVSKRVFLFCEINMIDNGTKFNVDHLEYASDYHVTESDRAHMGEEIYNEYLSEMKKADDKVIFSNVCCSWDSCDCGDGYGCSHGSWVYEIRFTNHEIAKVESEDDGWHFMGDSGEELFINHSDFTIGDFRRFCQLCNIELIDKKIL